MSEQRTHLRPVQPDGWPPPKGYANGMVGSGKTLWIAGQVGWNRSGAFESSDLVGQFAVALDNVLAVVRAAGGTATDIAQMTVFVTDIAAYRQSVKQLGPLWRERMGSHFPAMALVAVSALVEPEAVVEIQATCCLAEESP